MGREPKMKYGGGGGEWSQAFSSPSPPPSFTRSIFALHSPVPELSFLPAPYMGAQPGRAKGESRITCMHMLRTTPFFPPNRGKNHIWKYFPDLACGSILATISAIRLIKNMSINPKSVEFHQCHANPYSLCFLFITISKITKEIFAKICWQLKTPTRTWKCTRCIMQMRYLYASAFLSKTFAKSLNIQK